MVLEQAMRIPGPFSNDNWDWLSRSEEGDDVRPESSATVGQVAWEIGVVLLVPLAGASVVELLLKLFRVY